MKITRPRSRELLGRTEEDRFTEVYLTDLRASKWGSFGTIRGILHNSTSMDGEGTGLHVN